MDVTNYIKKCCLERSLQIKDLATKTDQSQQNLTNKLRTNNFKVTELEKIAQALDSTLELKLIDSKTGAPIL